MRFVARLRRHFRSPVSRRCRWSASTDELADESSSEDLRSGEFSSAWVMFDRATEAARGMADAWNRLVGGELFRSSVYVDDDGSGYLDVLVDEYETHRLDDLEHTARQFVEVLLACAREAVLAAENCVSGPLRSPGGEHLPRFPLFGTESEFLEFIDSGAVSGLRPDQIQLLEQFQPYYRSNLDDDSRRPLRSVMTRLFGLAAVLERNTRPIVAFWAHSAHPMVEADAPVVVTELQPFPDGVLVDWHRVAAFRVTPGTTGVRGNPNIAFDPIFNTEPWPDSPDNNMSVQCRGLLRVIEC